jgi:hypothetical protein
MAVSIYNDLIHLSVVYMSLVWVYNDAGFSKYPILKNHFSAIGGMLYCWGATYIIGKVLHKLSFEPAFGADSTLLEGHHQPLSRTSIVGILSSGVIVTLTVCLGGKSLHRIF